MSLENAVKDIISQKLEDGTVETAVSAEFEKMVNAAMNQVFRSYGDVAKIVEEKIKQVMVPYLEKYDYSKYIVKLDGVLTEILNKTAVPHTELLENFKELMIPTERKSIIVTELFAEWKKYIVDGMSTDNLEIDYNDGVSYCPANISFTFEEDADREWSDFKYGKIFFECEQDEAMNVQINTLRDKHSRDKGWDFGTTADASIRSLRYLNQFEILLLKLQQNGAKLILDTTNGEDEAYSTQEPEASFG